jgi:preprotein translocase subunit YajC
MSETILAVLAMAPRTPGGEQPSILVSLIPFALIFVMFYFLLIAPARKKQKRHAEMIGNLKPGDKVITNGGIHGTVAGVSDHVIQIKIADQVKIEISKNAVAALQAEPQ